MEIFEWFKTPENDPKKEKTENDPNKKEEKPEMTKNFKIMIEEAKQVVKEYEGKTIEDELEREASIGELERYSSVKDSEVKWAICDMILQLETGKKPLVSLLNAEEIQKRKEMIEGNNWMMEKTKQWIQENFTINDMQIFGINISEQNEFEEMKDHIFQIIEETEWNIVYFPLLPKFNVREKNGKKYHKDRVSGFNNHDWNITINVWAMNNYTKESEFEEAFRNVMIHETTHTLEEKWYEILFNENTGIIKEIFGENKEAMNLLNSMFTEWTTIALSNKISGIHNFDDYQFDAIIIMNHLFYENEEKTNAYGKIFSKLKFFWKITEEDKTILTEYLKTEFSKEPIQWYLDLIEKSKTAKGDELKEITSKKYEKLTIMSGEKPNENIFLQQIYPWWNWEESIQKFKEDEINYPSRSSL